MSVIDPLNAKDYLIKMNRVRELLTECEIGPAFMEALNQKVINMLIDADTRRKQNRRKRIYSCDL